MTLQQLEYFRVMAKVLHYTKASEMLYISQPSLSYAISELEKELTVPLFEKSGKKTVLSKFGVHFLVYVEEALDKLSEGREMIAQMIDPLCGSINLGYIYSLSFDFLPYMIKSFCDDITNSKITFNFFQHQNEDIIQNLLDGTLDLAFSVGTSSPFIDSVAILDQELFLIVPRRHPLAGQKEVSLLELKDENFVTLKSSSGLRMLLNSIFHSAGITPRISFEAEECNAMASFVSANLGVAILPNIPSLDCHNLAILKIKDPPCRRIVYLSWSNKRFMPPPVLKFKDFVISKLQIL